MFQLAAEVTGRQPMKKTIRSVQLYELDSVQLNITNPLSKAGNFLVKLIITRDKISVDEFFLIQKGT